jgi:MFS family permease
MAYFTNSNISRLALHSTALALAFAMSTGFSAAFLFRAGLAPAQIFLSFAAILALRFAARPIVLYVAPILGLRRTFIFGALVNALSCPALALVDGIGKGLVCYIVLTSVGQVFYFTCYHVFFTAHSDGGRCGAQLGAFQMLGTLATIAGPAAGGFLLAMRGPQLTFSAAFFIALIGVLPLLRIAEVPLARKSPPQAYAAAKTGVKLFFADGWIQMSLTSAWSLVLFEALHDRYDFFGGTLSAAALAGAVGGLWLGRHIDRGRAHHAVWINAVILLFVVAARVATFGNAAAAVAVAIATTAVAGIYIPSWLTAVYNDAKLAPCTFRFQFAAEGGWDAGGVAAALIAAALCGLGLPVDAAMLLALPMVFAQALVLERAYARQDRSVSTLRARAV